MRREDCVLMIGYFVSETLHNHSVCEDLAVLLEERGWKVLQASSATRRLPRLVGMLRATWRGRHSFQTACVDVYSGAAFMWAEAVCALLRFLNKPYILTLRGGSLPIFAARHPLRMRHLLQSAWCVTTPSSYLAEKMSPYRASLRLVPNPLSIEHYDFRLRSAPQPKLVWMRAFHDVYHPELAIQTLQRVLAKYPGTRLLMFGPDKGDGSLQRTQRLVNDLGLADHVEFPGGVPKAQVPARLHEGDIYLNTPNIDNTPITVLEALALGVCVVTTNVGGIPYLVKDGRDALIVPPSDPAAMADAVCRLLEDPALAVRLSLNGRKNAESRDWSKILPLWLELLEQSSGSEVSAVSRRLVVTS